MTGHTERLPRTPEGIALRCQHRLVANGVCVVARVRESERAFDLAIGGVQHTPVVIRCVAQVTAEDRRALATMIAEGDFNRAVIVYADEDQPQLTSEIEAYPLSRIDELAASLARERLS